MIPENITREHLLKAISKIDQEGLPQDGDSRYYDVIYDGKKYPPKLVVSYANIFANGEKLDRTTFRGGKDTPCFNLLLENNFSIKNKSVGSLGEPKVWFVAQGATFLPDKGMTYLWAPAEGKDHQKRFYWDNVLKVKKGDIIFNYSEGLKGISIALTDGYEANNIDNNSPWGQVGYRVDIEMIKLLPVITRTQLIEHQNTLNEKLSTISKKPFNKFGGVNQGYLFEFTKEAGKVLRDIYGKEFGHLTIDNFFNEVEDTKMAITKKTYSTFTPESFSTAINNIGLYCDNHLTLRLVGSLITKPFLILTGLSGSGKTKLAQSFVQWICESKNQYKIVPVGADWTNREPLLGYPNGLEPKQYITPDSGVIHLFLEAVKEENKEKPFFLILDEMNLSHVERYFADFLSIMESEDTIKLYTGDERESLDGLPIPKEIRWPKNVFIIGTVNIDETTYMFSPKVLDRANVIEFRITSEEIGAFLTNPGKPKLEKLIAEGAGMAADFLQKSMDNGAEVSEGISQDLLAFFNQLKKVGAEFGYRSASEIMILIRQLKTLNPEISDNECLDIAVMQKLLPKLHGSRSKLAPVLKALAALCVDGISTEEFLKTFDELYKKEFDNIAIKYEISFEKLIRMYSSVLANGFTSYAEA